MAALPDQVLGWLYNNLKTNYRNVDRSYSEIAQTLARNPTLSPRTEVYTFDNGTSALLLVLRGTLPIAFRGTTYRYPIALWVPYDYPQEAPMAFVVPTQDMVVRPGQHVSVDGRVYHPYIAHWKDDWQSFNLAKLLEILVDIFSKEPPVMVRQRPAHGLSSGQSATPPPLPDAPHRQQQQALPARTSSLRQSGPPPPPPKPPGPQESTTQAPIRNGTPDYTSRGPPALPSKPGQHAQQYPAAHLSQSVYSRDNTQPPYGYQTGPPQIPVQQDVRRSSIPPMSPAIRQRLDLPYRQDGPSQLGPPGRDHYQQSQNAPSYPPHQSFHPQQQYPPHQQQTQYAQQYQTQPPPPPPPPQQQQQKQPIQDLLSTNLDNPSQPHPISFASSNQHSAPPPPPPPNPERDALLHTLSQTLQSHLQQTLHQNSTRLSSLSAQHTALLTAQSALSTELTALQSLSSLLSTNESALHAALAAADEQIDALKTAQVPNVDEILVAPTVVAEQLYRLVAEEKGIGEAMFVLGRALDRGRVGGEVFVRVLRQLARERFLKKVLVGKIARGLGLDGAGGAGGGGGGGGVS